MRNENLFGRGERAGRTVLSFSIVLYAQNVRFDNSFGEKFPQDELFSVNWEGEMGMVARNVRYVRRKHSKNFNFKTFLSHTTRVSWYVSTVFGLAFTFFCHSSLWFSGFWRSIRECFAFISNDCKSSQSLCAQQSSI